MSLRPVELAEPEQISGALAPLGNDATVVDLLDRVLQRGVTVTGDVVLSVAGVDLVYLGIRLVLKGVDDTDGVPS
jgi:gas vesicle structural protein